MPTKKTIIYFTFLLFTFLLFTFLLFIDTSLSVADDIYKSVDENGKVTYSSTPTHNSKQATTVDITPPPSKARIKAAQQRFDRNKQAAEIADKNRKQRDAIIAEENRLKREKQKQLQQKQQAEKNNENQDYGYPYYPRQRPPGRPVMRPPVAIPRRLPGQIKSLH